MLTPDDCAAMCVAVAVRVVTGVVVLLSKTHIQFWYFSLCCFESDHVYAGGFENTYDMLLLVRKLNTLVHRTTGTLVNVTCSTSKLPCRH